MNVPHDRLIRRAEVREQTGLTNSPIDRLMREGKFPKSVPLVEGGRAVGWSERAVQKWIAERLERGAA